MDALLTQRHVAQTIVENGGDDVMIVQENQARLRADIALIFTLPPVGDRQATARTVDLGHGRIEQRHSTTSTALVGDSDGPGLAQIFELGRHVLDSPSPYSCLVPWSPYAQGRADRSAYE